MNKTEKRMKIFTLIMQVIISSAIISVDEHGDMEMQCAGISDKIGCFGRWDELHKEKSESLWEYWTVQDEQMMVQILMLFICELVMVLVIQVIGIVNLILALGNHHKLLLDIMSLIAGCMISFLGADGAVFSDPLSQVYPFLLVVLLVINFDRCEAD